MTKSRFITHTITNAAGRNFAVRYVPTGAAYGREDCLVNERGPMVEFYSMKDDDSTRFVSRYYVETFLGLDGCGLALVGSDSSFNLTAENCQEVAAEVTEPDCGCGNGWSCEVCR